jgi:hypothetical protein
MMFHDFPMICLHLQEMSAACLMGLPQPLNQLRPVKDVAKGRGALVLRGAHARLRPIRRGWQWKLLRPAKLQL